MRAPRGAQPEVVYKTIAHSRTSATIDGMADKLKVLIVEDDMLMGTLLSEALWRYEFEPILAKDGDEGLKTLEKTLPHLVLLDLILPGINGFEVLERIKSNARTKDIPVIIVSNLGDKSDIERGLSLGAEDYLVKANMVPKDIVGKIQDVVKKFNLKH